MIIFHDPDCVNYQKLGHPEAPFRVRDTAELLSAAYNDWDWKVPELCGEKDILRAHTKDFFRQVKEGEGDFDGDTPRHKNIFKHAMRSAGGAVAVMEAALAGKKAFSLLRPPGHHACKERAMGFCYFNSIAIAALAAQAKGVGNVAVWDFDAHHGNGTEDILLGKKGFLYASVHEYPGYPGTGTRSKENALNWTVAPYGSRKEHMEKLEASWEKVLEFKPELILISAGFDAFKEDPITEMNLEAEDFATFGKWVRESGFAAGSILEGGYSKRLPELVEQYLSELEPKH